MLLTKILKYASGLFYLISGPLIHGWLLFQERHMGLASTLQSVHAGVDMR